MILFEELKRRNVFRVAIDGGWLSHPRLSKQWVQLKPLEGDPEFEAIQARILKHMNAERAKLNLESMSI